MTRAVPSASISQNSVALCLYFPEFHTLSDTSVNLSHVLFISSTQCSPRQRGDAPLITCQLCKKQERHIEFVWTHVSKLHSTAPHHGVCQKKNRAKHPCTQSRLHGEHGLSPVFSNSDFSARVHLKDLHPSEARQRDIQLEERKFIKRNLCFDNSDKSSPRR